MKKILLVCVILALTVGCSTKKVPSRENIKKTALQNNFRKRIRCLKNNTNIENNGCKNTLYQSCPDAQSTKRIISNVVLKLIYEFAKHSKPRLTGRLNVLIASSLLPNNRNKRIYSQIKTNRL